MLIPFPFSSFRLSENVRTKVKAKVFHSVKVFRHSGTTRTSPYIKNKINFFNRSPYPSRSGECEAAGKEKSETEIITRAKARITTRTGEIPLLIPNLSGWLLFAIFSAIFRAYIRACIHGYLRIFSRARGRTQKQERKPRSVYSGKTDKDGNNNNINNDYCP